MSETKPLVVITRPIPEAGVDLLRHRYQVKMNLQDRVLRPEELVRFARGAQALLIQLTDRIDGKILDGIGRQLKVVANYAVGFDNLDLAAAKKRQVVVTNTPVVSTEAVAEHAFMLLLAVARRLVEADKFVRAGKYHLWELDLFLGQELRGKTLGILGLGHIGSRVAEIGALGYQMKVLYYDPAHPNDRDLRQRLGAEPATIRKLLTNSDYLSLHVPLTPKTRHLIGRIELQSMKKTAILINTARGPVVDEKALIAALKNGIIWGAGLDVYEFEPKISKELMRLPNVILTPHIASSTHEARDAMARLAAKNIIAVLEGRRPLTSAR